MIIAFVPLLVALIGLVMYLISTNGKVQRIGEILFFCGILAWCLTMNQGEAVLRIK